MIGPAYSCGNALAHDARSRTTAPVETKQIGKVKTRGFVIMHTHNSLRCLGIPPRKKYTRIVERHSFLEVCFARDTA